MRRRHWVDLLTQRWVVATERRVDLRDHPWLEGPASDPRVIGREWIEGEARRLGGRVAERDESAGPLPSMKALAGEGFDPSRLRPEIADFYERTARWRLEVWSQWSPGAWPFGWALTTIFARRLQQLSLPLRPLDAALGMDSEVVRAVEAAGAPLGAA